MNQFERIQLVILSYNRLDCMPRLFEELLVPAALRGVQVTVVDNASELPLQEYISKFSGKQNIEIVQNTQNSGVAKGRNAGFRRSEREFIVYLDDDSLMQLDTLESVPDVFDELPGAGILAFRVIHGETGEAQNEHGLNRVQVGNFHGAGHAIRRSALNKVGFLDEECFFGAEEIEFTMRMLASGMKTIFVPEVLVRHFSYSRSGKDKLQRRLDWARNYTMVLFRYLPASIALMFSIRLLASYLIGGLKEIKFGAVFLFPAMIHGARKGLNSSNQLAAAGVAFYVNPNTRPELGNVSLLSKIRFKLIGT